MSAPATTRTDLVAGSSGAPGDPVLEVEDLHVSYGDDDIVRGVSFTIGRGEIVALVGESGSGKSTTAAAILHLLPQYASVRAKTISLAGTELQGASEPELRARRGVVMAYVPQDPAGSLDPVHRIRQQVGEVLRVHKLVPRAEQPAQVTAALREAGIAEPERIGAAYPHELSGGLQQRALIAQAFAGGPELIVADEPTSALDVTVQKEVLDNLASAVAERRVAVLLITHDLAMASERADRVLVLRDGRIIEQGTAAQVLGNPREEYTRSLVAATPAAIADALRAKQARLDVIERPDGAARPDAERPGERPAPLLRVTDLVKTFRSGAKTGPRRIHAVDHVSFDIAAGSTLAIVGESGSGKTTTARIISHLERPDAGSVRLNDSEITGLRGAPLRQLRRRIQYVHQNPRSALNPRLTVAEAIGEPLRAFKIGSAREQRERVRELLDRVALPSNVFDRSSGQLSGGQAQRVGIARALALEPEVLVLDEAVSALDVSVQERILTLLEQLRDDLGLTYVFVSHDLSVVARIASDVLVMRSGKIVEAGTALAVLDSPQHEYTQRLLQAVPGFSADRVRGVPARGGMRSTP